MLIGFNDRDHEGKHVTVDGRSLAEAGYAKWGPDEPNNEGGTEDCGSVRKDGLLNDVGCGIKAAFACELPLVNAGMCIDLKNPFFSTSFLGCRYLFVHKMISEKIPSLRSIFTFSQMHSNGNGSTQFLVDHISFDFVFQSSHFTSKVMLVSDDSNELFHFCDCSITGMTGRKPLMTPSGEQMVIQEGDQLTISCQGERGIVFSTPKSTTEASIIIHYTHAHPMYSICFNAVVIRVTGD